MSGKYWQGYDEPVDPATMHFTAIPGATCEGCIFYRQRSNVCHKAEQAAALIDLPICSVGPGYIYILDKSDARQLRIKSESATGEAAALSDHKNLEEDMIYRIVVQIEVRL